MFIEMSNNTCRLNVRTLEKMSESKKYIKNLGIKNPGSSLAKISTKIIHRSEPRLNLAGISPGDLTLIFKTSYEPNGPTLRF